MLLYCPTFPPQPTPPGTPTSFQQSPPQFMSMGHANKFFGFSISYTILNTCLSILYLPIMLLNHFTFSPILYLPSQLLTLQMISISMILFLFQLFAQFVFLRFICSQLLICCQFNVHSFDLLFLKYVPLPFHLIMA